jgi:predicted ATP-dependent protease
MDSSKLELAAAEAAFSVNLEKEAFAADESRLEARPGWGREVIGQPRALEALNMGVGIRSKGYNVYVSGAPGTGRRSAVLSVLNKAAEAQAGKAPDELRDIAFVYNFDTPLSPKALSFRAGSGREFKRDLHRFVEALKRIVSLQDQSEVNKKEEAEAVAVLEAEENRGLAEFEAALAADGFRAVQVEGENGPGMDIVPLKPSADGKEAEETSFEALQDLVATGELEEADYNQLRERWYGHVDRMKTLFASLRRGRSELQERLSARRDEALRPQVQAESALLSERWKDEAEVAAWIARLAADVEERLYLFRAPAESGEGRRRRSPALSRYGVNLVVDRSNSTKIPVIVENHPTAANLFGFIEPRPEEEGDTKISYLRIRSGSFLQASGGFLVLRAEDVIADEECWVRLKRVLQDGRVEIQPREGPQGLAWIKPEAVSANVKVVMIGGESTYDILYQGDMDFPKLFKIHAEFDSTMPRDAAGLRDYAAFVRKIVDEEGLLPVTAIGLDAVAEEGVRLSEYRDRLSTRFGAVADLLRESDYRARLSGARTIDAEAVRAAVSARAHLANLPEEKIGEMINSGEIILQVQGRATGRVNGLAVHDRGYYAFGLPAVISAQVSPGESGVINIEGESGLSGEIYDKAVLIVEGFIRSRYSRDMPLAITASICFEQSYTAVEGDSASSTAVYALLSAIAGIPLRQDIAVTGSLNQIGQVQPVGGVTEKIVGFYRVCEKAGFTGTQGVMLPRRNIVNLTLPREVQDAIAEGRFHLWAVSSIDEGLEVLSGIPAGEVSEKGEFPASSFNGKVRKELLRMARTIKNYMG